METNKIIINLAPTGVIPNNNMTSHVPITPKEVALDVYNCAKFGLSCVHVHARDENQEQTGDSQRYVQYIEAIREKVPEMVICVSCSGRKDPNFESRSQVLSLTGDLRPDMASLTLSSLNFTKTASLNSPDTIIRLAEKMQNNGIKPELEIFDVGMVNYAHYLIKKGYLLAPYYFNIILGNIASAQANLLHLGMIIKELPSDSIWTVGGIGNAQLSANLMAISQGGGVRVGLEDNIWFDEERTELATNQSMMERIIKIIRLMGKEIISPKELRTYLKLI
ncbi:3-keto-5-aminohexanoate cleavage protein [Geminocystis sp. GBBB08]|uniref:3-keto-5-aminohexanoate cleavage protein n=1 Tax=Geminocystis sp. GBBB08 TaxID=2604140 RepID=UPI0027E38C4C|nr:3-keto-5-aminohexanoate cleavage protein [Geminocystis sp. GBBB08]MBL1209360.1 3-keto-5-aminohexanoate cleavage protein [Geminocystis sp. GBBB08]